MIKRLFDVIAALFGLALLLPLMSAVALVIKWGSRGPVFFRQERIGKGFQPFFIYKFRTMVEDASLKGRPITCGDDPRITRVGRFLRKAKVDELPQLINVLKGEMSLVGPRPELRQYVERFSDDYREILSVRPGITDLSSLKYADEAALLGRSNDPEGVYVKEVLPDKIRLAKEYIKQSSLLLDFALVLRTIPKVFGSKASPIERSRVHDI